MIPFRSIPFLLWIWLGLFLLGPVYSVEEEPAVSLSISFDLDEPSVILFPGQAATAALELGVHPSRPEVWKDVRVRFVARRAMNGGEDDSSPIAVTALHASNRRRLNVSLDEWYYTSYLGMGQNQGEIEFEVSHQRTSKQPVELFAEVESTEAERSSTAPFQIRCASVQLVDLRDLASAGDDDVIADTDTAWISYYESGSMDLPIMPRLEARIEGLPSEYTVFWLLQSRYGRRGDLDKVQFPKKGWTDVAGDSAWKVYASYHERYFGGEAKINYRIENDDGDLIYTGSRPFKIRCRNPRDAGAKAYIEKKQGGFWFASAIAQHESRQNKLVFNQFNNAGNVAYEPNFGPPDGWGMFQIDSARGKDVTTEEVWDWRENVRAALDEMKTAKIDTRKYFAAIKKTYPSQWEEPPSSYIPSGCKTSLTAEEASIIQLYNGAAIVKKLKNRFNTWSYYRSCWQFSPGNSSGKRWTFFKNRNNYVYKILKNEIEGKMPISE